MVLAKIRPMNGARNVQHARLRRLIVSSVHYASTLTDDVAAVTKELARTLFNRVMNGRQRTKVRLEPCRQTRSFIIGSKAQRLPIY